jgi:hypothetical protein
LGLTLWLAARVAPRADPFCLGGFGAGIGHLRLGGVAWLFAQRRGDLVWRDCGCGLGRFGARCAVCPARDPLEPRAFGVFVGRQCGAVVAAAWAGAAWQLATKGHNRADSGLSEKTESCYAVNIMASKARLGTFDQLLAETNSSAEIHAIATKLREIILEIFPAAIEVVRLGEGTASYGVGEKKMSESHVYIMPKDTYVNLGFWHSTELHDPSHLLEGTGKKLRHVKMYTLELAQALSIRALITDALEKRKQALAKK